MALAPVVGVAELHDEDEVHLTQFAIAGVPLVPFPPTMAAGLHIWIVVFDGFQTAPVRSAYNNDETAKLPVFGDA